MTKKTKIVLISVLLSVAIIAGIIIGVLSVPRFTVIFNTDGGSAVETLKNVSKGAKITAPKAPVKENYAFDGWYKDKECADYWSFRNDTVTGDITLYAKWKIAYSLNLTYETNSDGKSFSVSKGSATDKDVTIPSKINGLPVTALSSRAFYNGYIFTSIKIPESVTSIGKDSFNLCVNLTRMVIPNSVETLGSYAFSGCSELTTVVLSDKLQSLETMTFSDCAKLESVNLPASLTKIGTYVFLNCKSLLQLEIPQNVTSVGAWAFKGCEKLESITINKNVVSLGVQMLDGCASLKQIIFNGTMEEWNAVDKNSDWKGNCLVNTVVCFDGQVSI